MSLIDKIKGILFDEEIEEIPEIKSEVKESKKEIIVEENPIKEIKLPKVEINDTEIQKNEPSFTFPIDFNDEEEEIYESPKVKYEQTKKTIKRENTSRDYSSYLNKRDDKKQFKPTPIISPVYGILDQNYKKEDVIVKKDILRKPTELSLEEVRKRAFGSLEDDIEQNLVRDVIKEEKKEEPKIEVKTKVVEEPVDKTKTIGELMEEDSMAIDIPKIESISDEEVEYTSSDVTDVNLEEPKNSIDDLLEREEDIVLEDEEEFEEVEEEIKEEDIDEEEADLFSLIDSMYEEKGE